MEAIITTILSLLTTLRDDRALSSVKDTVDTCNIRIKRLKNNTIRIDLMPLTVPATTANPFK